MKFLFLDIDGVLNNTVPVDYRGGMIKRENVENLNIILKGVPECQVVLSSAWRYMILSGDMSLRGFEQLLMTHGADIWCRLHGHTIDDNQFDDRGLQIKEYLDRHDHTHFAILDDCPTGMNFHPLSERLVRTNSKHGLTAANARKALNLLS